ncbi:hypothetical protein MPTK1_6g00380 [Marchantia polymorpha subsp. ruderalis]|uniref:Uncharacterized protein n=2 Tax=Marchantia polymorpha TaxID=3197 RepID=A0AAF6BM12_MARPO|nr:hypothetical protein MARPO_0104s0028 [Marchantia polymorpha]BBN13046.1 hypothetical protein Mp_6g00380 [Marchantia polymorpha subsp. ruderalis]|eukprot:PTQ31999.1 hypothetical protein MARPO_0104s0028 [Marchantia polymorpha]
MSGWHCRDSAPGPHDVTYTRSEILKGVSLQFKYSAGRTWPWFEHCRRSSI